MANTFIALIPARSGSKSIIQKNLKEIGKKTLVEHAIAASIANLKAENIYLSTDCMITSDIGKKFGINVVKRNAQMATDTATAADVVEDFCKNAHLKINLENIDIIYLQPTSPLRSSIHVKEAIELYEKEKAKDSILMSVCLSEIYPEKLLEKKPNGPLQIYSEDSQNFFSNRQNFHKYFRPNGAIYIFNLGDFIKKKEFPTKKVVGYEMDVFSSIDIDNKNDLIMAELFYSHCKNTS